VTRSLLEGHKPLSITQAKTLMPLCKELTTALAWLIELKFPLPDNTCQVPVPDDGVFAASTADVEQMV
jgi:hypothetical protein